MEPALVVALVSILAAPLAAFVTWFFNRKKYVSEIYAVISESSQTAVETMQLTMNSLHTELKDQKEKTDFLLNESIVVRRQLDEVKTMYTENLLELKMRRRQVYELTATIHDSYIQTSDEQS